MAFMTFNKEQAEKAGAIRFESGAHIGLLQAEMITASTGTKGMEFNLHGETDISYISIYYELHDGTEIKGGQNMIQALMAILRVNEINVIEYPDQEKQKNIYKVKEFENKRIGMVLQKVLYTKQDGADSYKIDLIMPYDANTMKTAQELIQNKPANTIEKLIKTLVDKDERTNKSDKGNSDNSYGMAQDNANASRPVSKFDQLPKNQGGFNQQEQQGGFVQQQANSADLSQSDEVFFS